MDDEEPQPPEPPALSLEEELEEQAREEDWTFDITDPEDIDPSEPPTERGGYVPPEDPGGLPPAEPISEDPLPDRFDWRDEGMVGPVRDQGECGSCWAFAACAVAESAHAIAGRGLPDLSEQWMVDCNVHGWGCDGGSLALSYFVDQPDACGAIGGVEESHAAYQGTHGRCGCGGSTLPAFGGWGVVTVPSEETDPETIKRAIHEFGPVWAHVIVDLPFMLYDGGVYNSHSLPFFSFPHAVVITGWDEGQGAEGVWFVRNSWGPLWGELGNMRIEYGANDIGALTAVLSEHPLEESQDETAAESSGDDPAQEPAEEATGGDSEPDEEDVSKPAQDETSSSDSDRPSPDRGAPASGGDGQELDVLDARLDILEEALAGDPEGVLEPTPQGVDVDLEDLKPDMEALDPAAGLLVGIWRQTAGPKGADLAPGGYTTGHLLIASSGLLEFDRVFGSRADQVHMRTRLDWTIKDGKLRVGEDPELRNGRLSRDINLSVGGATVRVSASRRSLPATLDFEVTDSQLVVDGRTYERMD